VAYPWLDGLASRPERARNVSTVKARRPVSVIRSRGYSSAVTSRRCRPIKFIHHATNTLASITAELPISLRLIKPPLDDLLALASEHHVSDDTRPKRPPKSTTAWRIIRTTRFEVTGGLCVLNRLLGLDWLHARRRGCSAWDTYIAIFDTGGENACPK